jgi:hypothetical protein
MQTREHLFAVMASRSSSVTSGCALDVALVSYHKEVNERSALPVLLSGRQPLDIELAH